MLASGLFLAVSGILSVAALGSGHIASDKTVTLTDPAGDLLGSSSGADITTVSLSTRGDLLTMAVTFARSFDPTHDYLDVYMDTDRNLSSGDDELAIGADYQLDAGALPGAVHGRLQEWTGQDWHDISAETASFQASLTGTTVTFQVSRNDLYDTNGFDYFVEAVTTDPSGHAISVDRFPNSIDGPGGSVGPPATFLLAAATTPTTQTSSGSSPFPRASFGAAHTIPSTVRAGKRLTVTFPIKLSNGAVIGGGTLRCTVTLAGKPVAHTAHIQNGKASVVLTVPKNSKGKLLIVKVSVPLLGAAVGTATIRVH